MSQWADQIRGSSFVDFVTKNWLLLCGQVILAILIGMRGLEVGTDTVRYAEWFKEIADRFSFYGNIEPGFNIFGLFIAFISDSVIFYFFCISLALFAMTNVIAGKVANFDGHCKHNDKQLIFGLILLGFLLSPFYVSAHINAIRQGMAGFMVFYAFLSLHDRRWMKFVIASIVAVSFHSSSAMYLVLFPLLLLPFPYLLAIAIGCSLLYATGLSEVIVKYLSHVLHLPLYDFVAGFRTDVSYESGVRYDFLIFSWIGLLFALIVRHFSDKKEVITSLLNIYIVLLVPFLMLGFANFSNRYAYTAWLFLSVLSAYAAYLVPVWQRFRVLVFPYGLIVGYVAFLVMAQNGFAR